MNILVPDSWLREFLKTKATPEQIKEYLSLCGPSVERIHKKNGETIYDIEITSNRPDAMSIAGIAREAAAILPRFGVAATFVNDPYKQRLSLFKDSLSKKLTIKTDPKLNPRWISIVLSNVKVGPSPAWLTKWLEATGIRSLNNVIDITNYLMRAYGQPAHAFDYDEIKGAKMTLRASHKGEKIVTLDGKTHSLPGDDIVIEDGDGRLIDLCGIMGGYNSSIKNTTTNVVLFMQTYDPMHIRKTSMNLAHRTEAAGLFEKGVDPELVLPAIIRGIELMQDLAGARVASKLYDIYPKPYKPYTVSITKEKLAAYIGENLTKKEIENILKPLGFGIPAVIPTHVGIQVTVPSWRRDVTIDVDIIEEVARIVGYHNIQSKLPASQPPVVFPDPQLSREQEIKIRLRDWGFTELYTYSMISKEQLHSQKAYKIANPINEEWAYMRPSLTPSMLAAIKENLKHTKDLKLFELSMIYEYRKNDLPLEIPTLIVACTGQHLPAGRQEYREAKGIAEALGLDASITQKDNVTILEAKVVWKHTVKKYIPIPKYPPIIEDFSFVVTPDFQVGPFIDVVAKIHTLIQSVKLLDAYENKRTFRVTYLDTTKTLTNLDVAPVHQKFLEYAAEKFGISPVI